jgi:AraC family transcriptional regulator of adaptative response/methylated-DNA-[protein]-cysteine methyltransferase
MPSDYSRVEKAILYLQDHFQEQPGLEELAEQVGLSPYHFQRLFKRWAGISPKRFLQFLTLEYAKKLLRERRSPLDVTYQAGLSSPSRLHDLFVSVDAVTPGQYRIMGSGLKISYGFHPSPFGPCMVALTDRGICSLSFVDAHEQRESVAALEHQWPQAQLEESRERTEAVARRIFAEPRDRQAHPLVLFLKGTNFQIKVWEALLRIPYGNVSTYQDIAGLIGSPQATRAVGNAVGANPVAYLIPCHRVIRSSGVIGNYRYGTVRKKAILGWELAQLSAG